LPGNQPIMLQWRSWGVANGSSGTIGGGIAVTGVDIHFPASVDSELRSQQNFRKHIGQGSV